MIITFYGLPGSGKTTVARQLAVSHEWTLVSFSGKFEIIRYFLWGWICHPLIFTKAFFHFIIRNRSLFYLWNFYIVQYAKYQKAQSLSKIHKYILLDEGPLQNIISYPNVALTKIDLLAYLQLVPKVDKTIVFSVNEQQRKLRLNKRKYHQSWRKKHADDENWDSDMIETDTLFKKYIEGDTGYHLVSGDTSPETIASTLIT